MTRKARKKAACRTMHAHADEDNNFNREALVVVTGCATARAKTSEIGL